MADAVEKVAYCKVYNQPFSNGPVPEAKSDRAQKHQDGRTHHDADTKAHQGGHMEDIKPVSRQTIHRQPIG